jgi:fructokinase
LADGTEISAPSNPVEVVDTVGAGDTFNAGVLAELQKSGHLTKSAVRNLTSDALGAALNKGAQVAAITVSRAGANPPWAHEL